MENSMQYQIIVCYRHIFQLYTIYIHIYIYMHVHITLYLHHTQECSRLWINQLQRYNVSTILPRCHWRLTSLPERRPERGNTGFGAPLRLDQDLKNCKDKSMKHLWNIREIHLIHLWIHMWNPYGIWGWINHKDDTHMFIHFHHSHIQLGIQQIKASASCPTGDRKWCCRCWLWHIAIESTSVE